VLIGGQGEVKYNFSPSTLGTNIIYDRSLTDGTYTLSATATTANPTTVLETPAGENIVIAVEFFNNDQDFIGINGQLIPKNTHFYLVAELDANDATETDSKIFKQDYTTTVNLILNDLSLGKAYNVLPDLRSNQLEIAFSVDLAWKTGHEYDIVF